jgi:hypothetical membrane protein
MSVVAAIAGFVGAVVIIVGWIVGILGYNSRPDKPFGRNYSPLTHVVSALGHHTTPNATVFNVCIAIGALSVGIVFLGIGLEIPSDVIKWFVIIVGILAAIGGVFVGFFPSGKPTDGSPHHLLFAMVFFLLSAVDVAIVSSFALFGDSTNPEAFPGPIAIPGILVVIAAVLMLIAGLVKMIPGDTDWSVPDLVDNPPPADQVPRIMFLPSAEWLYVILLNVWVLVFSIFLLTRA